MEKTTRREKKKPAILFGKASLLEFVCGTLPPSFIVLVALWQYRKAVGHWNPATPSIAPPELPLAPLSIRRVAASAHCRRSQPATEAAIPPHQPYGADDAALTQLSPQSPDVECRRHDKVPDKVPMAQKPRTGACPWSVNPHQSFSLLDSAVGLRPSIVIPHPLPTDDRPFQGQPLQHHACHAPAPDLYTRWIRKYKGCETCRRRRVKCSNERPYCQKCISSGRQCEGYERERVFITGTPENKGRVASHPKKGSSSKKQNTPTDDDPPRLDLVPLQPLTSAWDDHTLVSNQGVEYSVLVTALHTRPKDILRDDSEVFHISFPPYTPSEFQPLLAERDFRVKAKCLARLPGVNERDDSAESYCVFFFEHDLSHASVESGSHRMRQMGPAYFSHFPSHHFFVRVYRPLATGYALLGRQDTFVSAPEWKSVPWQRHPKCLLDQLLDLILFLPSIFAQTDQVVPLEATLSRHHRAQQLLHDCLSLEVHFDAWLQLANRPTHEYPLAYWAEELTSPGGLIPFSNSYTFKDGNTGLSFLYYWMAQILFHRCIENLHRVIFQPVIDAYPNMWPDLPSDLQIDISRYQHGRVFAADICRGLDSVLDSTVQPDMLTTPMTVAMDLYREINATSQDGLMEIMWLDNFRSRLVEKGQYVAGVLQRQKWAEVATF
ncbi:hypothetical protein ACJZ2D_005681 [Fusarium nematophilum]